MQLKISEVESHLRRLIDYERAGIIRLIDVYTLVRVPCKQIIDNDIDRTEPVQIIDFDSERVRRIEESFDMRRKIEFEEII